MRVLVVVLLLVFVLKIDAENVWLKDLISPTGLDLGYGIGLKLNENRKEKNVPVMERLSLDLNFGDVAGVRLGNPKSDGVEMDLYIKDINSEGEVSGRSKKNSGGGKQMMQMIIGYKAALMATMMFAVMKFLTMKSIFLTTTTLMISLLMLLLRMVDKKSTQIIEVEQHDSPNKNHHSHGGYGQYVAYQPHGYVGGYDDHNGYGNLAQSSNVYNDIVYAASATDAETNGAYASVIPNGSVVQAVSGARNNQGIDRRKEKSFYRKSKRTGTENNLSNNK